MSEKVEGGELVTVDASTKLFVPIAPDLNSFAVVKAKAEAGEEVTEDDLAGLKPQQRGAITRILGKA